MHRNDELFINDILESIVALENYLEDATFETFKNNRMLYSATIRELEIIGEAAGKISEEIKAAHPEIEWRKIKDFRNILIYEYFGVDAEIVWNMVTEKLPLLKDFVTKISRCHALRGNEKESVKD